MAEREGFEPSKHFHAYTVSNRAPSATRTPLRGALLAHARPCATGPQKWRRERDSNPRYGCPYSGFRDRPIQPLSHLSAGENTRVISRFPGGCSPWYVLRSLVTRPPPREARRRTPHG